MEFEFGSATLGSFEPRPATASWIEPKRLVHLLNFEIVVGQWADKRVALIIARFAGGLDVRVVVSPAQTTRHLSIRRDCRIVELLAAVRALDSLAVAKCLQHPQLSCLARGAVAAQILLAGAAVVAAKAAVVSRLRFAFHMSLSTEFKTRTRRHF